jgi:hypothetical protein
MGHLIDGFGFSIGFAVAGGVMLLVTLACSLALRAAHKG